MTLRPLSLRGSLWNVGSNGISMGRWLDSSPLPTGWDEYGHVSLMVRVAALGVQLTTKENV